LDWRPKSSEPSSGFPPPDRSRQPPVAQGIPETAEVFAQQAKSAGINVVLDPVPTSVLSGTQALKWPFSTDYWGGDGYLVTLGQTMLPTSGYPDTHFNNPRFTSL
jgi:ABC-type transport system substrate-binding protein